MKSVFSHRAIALLAVAYLLATPEIRAVEQSGQERMSDYYILSVGINKYEILTQLGGAVNDAVALAKVFEKRGHSSVAPRVLLNEQATKAAIVDHLKKMGADVPIGASVMIALSGHGTRLGNNFIFAAQDFDPANPANSGLTGAELLELLKPMTVKKACRVVLILDACNAGTIRKDLSDYGGLGSSSLAAFQGSKNNEGGLILFASTIPSQLSRESITDFRHGYHGFLTESLLHIFDFRGGALRKGEITLSEMRHELPLGISLLGEQQKIPGVNVNEQDFVVAASLSIPETTSLLASTNQKPGVIEPVYRFSSAHPGATVRTVAGYWVVEKPMHRLGRTTTLKNAFAAAIKGERTPPETDEEVVRPPVPMLYSDGTNVTEKFQLILEPSKRLDPQKYPWAANPIIKDRPMEQGVFEVHYSSFIGNQSGKGRYTFGEKGLSVLRLIYENGTDEIRITMPDADHLTLESERVFSFKASHAATDLFEKTYRILSENVTYEMTREK